MVKDESHSIDSIYENLVEERITFISIDVIAQLFDVSRNYAAQIIFRLKKNGLIEEVEKGKYLVEETESSNPLPVCIKTITPSYISFKTALIHYCLIDDTDLKEIFIATPKRKSPLTFHSYNFKYVTLKPYRFFGYHSQEIDNEEIFIADIEKALLDCMIELNYGVDIKDFIDVIQKSMPDLSIERLLDYALRFNDKSLIARLGYIFEQIGIQLPAPDDTIPKDFIKLNPLGERKGKWDNHWKIIDNL